MTDVRTSCDPVSASPTVATEPVRGRALAFVAGIVFVSVLSAGVGAGAAALITSAQIKNGTIVGVDVKNSGLTGKDLRNGSVTSKDLKDGSVTGGDIADGSVTTNDLGAAARAVISDRIPSGRTVTGTGYFDVQGTSVGGYGFGLSLPARAHADLTDDMVNFSANGNAFFTPADTDPECSGTIDTPTAPAGKVCLYLVTASFDTTSLSGESARDTLSDRGFSVQWTDSGGDVFVSVVWAYTAP